MILLSSLTRVVFTQSRAAEIRRIIAFVLSGGPHCSIHCIDFCFSFQAAYMNASNPTHPS